MPCENSVDYRFWWGACLNRLKIPRLAALLLSTFFAVPASAADHYARDIQFTPERGSLAAAIEGDMLVVGAGEGWAGALQSAGRVYVYGRGPLGWVLRQELVAPDPAAADHFGSTVALEGDTLVVGAPSHRHTANPNIFAGAYVFRLVNDAWQFEQELLPSDLNSYQWLGFFGGSVSLDQGTIAIGAHGTVQFDEGVYIFGRHTAGAWVEQAKLQVLNQDIAVGRSVALSGDRLVTTAGSMTHSFIRSGGVWSYEGPVGWGEQVALDDDLAMVSHSRSATPTITFYRQQGGAWSVQQVIETPVGARPPNGRLDTPIAFLGDRMAFGVPDSPADGGQIQVYERVGGVWVHRQTFTLPQPDPFTSFGAPVAFSPQNLIGGGSSLLNIYSLSSGRFTPVTPCRVFDTRFDQPPLPLRNGVGRAWIVSGTCGIPASARSVAANVTITQASGPGHLVFHAANQLVPGTSTLSFGAGQTRANNATLALGGDGTAELRAFPAIAASGSVHVILDVSGYFE